MISFFVFKNLDSPLGIQKERRWSLLGFYYLPLRGQNQPCNSFLFPVRETRRKQRSPGRRFLLLGKGFGEEWNDWKWQLRHRVTKLEQCGRFWN